MHPYTQAHATAHAPTCAHTHIPITNLVHHDREELVLGNCPQHEAHGAQLLVMRQVLAPEPRV